MKSYDHVGYLIKTRRINKNMMQSDLARKLGYSCGQYIYNVEKGNCRLNKAKAFKICELLEININELINAAKKDLEKEFHRAHADSYQQNKSTINQ